MKRIPFLLFVPLVACTLGPPPTEGDLAITNVTVLPMDTERTLSDQTVVIRDGRVVHLGPSASVRVAEGVETIDGQGRFLLPSFVDASSKAAERVTHSTSGTKNPGEKNPGKGNSVTHPKETARPP